MGRRSLLPAPMALTDTRIRNTPPGPVPFKLKDRDGLVLIVYPKTDRHPEGRKLWRRRLRVNGKETMFAIGRYPDVGLAEARQKAQAAFELARKGTNPAKQRKAEKVQQAAEGEA